MKKIQRFLAAVGLAIFGVVGTANAELIIFEWGGYEDENFFPDYMAKYGKAPSYLSLIQSDAADDRDSV